MTRRRRSVIVVIVVAIAAVAGGVWYAHRPSRGHPSAMVPADTTLRRDWLYFYPRHTTRASRALVVLFGNDVAFWEPHQDLAWRLADEGYDVVGVDLRRFLNTLPSAEPQRDSAFAVAMPRLIARCRQAMHADTLPLILGGHSFGAELAIWVAAHRPPPRLAGLLLLNPRGSGHLFITPGDWLNHEASGAWSWSTVDAVRTIAPSVRIALVRSQHDPFRAHDPAFVAAGGDRLHFYLVPFATHGMKTMLVAAPIIVRAVRFLADSTAGQ